MQMGCIATQLQVDKISSIFFKKMDVLMIMGGFDIA